MVKNLKYIKFFYSYLGARIFLSLFLSILIGLLDGLGLAMFMPLLQSVNGAEGVGAEGMGNLSFIIDFLYNVGFSLDLNSILLFMLLLFSVKGLLKFIGEYYKVIVKQLFVSRLRVETIHLLSKYSYKSFIKSDSGRIQNTLSAEVFKVSIAYQSFIATLQSVCFILVYTVLAFSANAQFAILVAAGGVLTSLVFNFVYKQTKKLSRSITKEGHKFQGYLIQAVSNFKYLKATARFDEYTEKLKKSVLKVEFEHKKVGFMRSVLASVKEPLVLLVVVIVILIQVNVFNASLGAIILSLLFFYRALNFVMMSQTSWNNFIAVIGSIENLQDLLNEFKSDQDIYNTNAYKGFYDSIHLKGISFSYGKKEVLKNISISINKNQTIALVGESGSGKTTLVNIISGLLPVKSGLYEIDGKKINNIDLISFQKKIGYITQESVIFDDTLFNNITFWDEPSQENLERFWKAVKRANIFDFVNELDEKESTFLGMNGILISGGQKQRISIARELYREIDILVMDEATASLDSENEKIIKGNIDQLKGELTFIIIAHRLSTIKEADKIYYLENGCLKSSGTFDELIENESSFRKMVDIQGLR